MDVSKNFICRAIEELKILGIIKVKPGKRRKILCKNGDYRWGRPANNYHINWLAVNTLTHDAVKASGLQMRQKYHKSRSPNEDKVVLPMRTKSSPNEDKVVLPMSPEERERKEREKEERERVVVEAKSAKTDGAFKNGNSNGTTTTLSNESFNFNFKDEQQQPKNDFKIKEIDFLNNENEIEELKVSSLEGGSSKEPAKLVLLNGLLVQEHIGAPPPAAGAPIAPIAPVHALAPSIAPVSPSSSLQAGTGAARFIAQSIQTMARHKYGNYDNPKTGYAPILAEYWRELEIQGRTDDAGAYFQDLINRQDKRSHTDIAPKLLKMMLGDFIPNNPDRRPISKIDDVDVKFDNEREEKILKLQSKYNLLDSSNGVSLAKEIINIGYEESSWWMIDNKNIPEGEVEKNMIGIITNALKTTESADPWLDVLNQMALKPCKSELKMAPIIKAALIQSSRLLVHSNTTQIEGSL